MNLSIVVPVYNTPLNLLKTCFNSILNQIFAHAWDIEVIVVNDASSSSDTVNFLKSICLSFPVVLISNEANAGVTYSRNIGFLKAKGDFVLFHDSDDSLLPNSITYLLSALSSFEHFVYGFIPSSRFSLDQLYSGLYCQPMSLVDVLLMTYNKGDMSLVVNKKVYLSLSSMRSPPFISFLRRHEFASLVRLAFLDNDPRSAIIFSFQFRSYAPSQHSDGLSFNQYSRKNLYLISLGHLVSAYYLLLLLRPIHAIMFLIKSFAYFTFFAFKLK